jgi:hypothetical protein
MCSEFEEQSWLQRSEVERWGSVEGKGPDITSALDKAEAHDIRAHGRDKLAINSLINQSETI